MSVQMELTGGATMLAEIQEYGTFSRETQRYICRSLEVAFAPNFSRVEWARSSREAEDIHAQMHVYRLLRASAADQGLQFCNETHGGRSAPAL